MNAKFYVCSYYDNVLWVGYLPDENGRARLYGSSPDLGVIYCASGRGEFLGVKYVLAVGISKFEMISYGPDRSFAELESRFKAVRNNFAAPAVHRDDFVEFEVS